MKPEEQYGKPVAIEKVLDFPKDRSGSPTEDMDLGLLSEGDRSLFQSVNLSPNSGERRFGVMPKITTESFHGRGRQLRTWTWVCCPKVTVRSFNP